MPLARRLSSSSQEAFSEFCEKNKPLSRRLSNASEASLGRRQLKTSGLTVKEAPSDKAVGAAKRSLPRRMSKSSSIGDTSRPAPSKQPHLKSPVRTRKGTAHVGGNKENDDDGNILQSPTPYWKVASERGTVSPRETRAGKKRKTTGKESGGRALSFDATEGNVQSPEQLREPKRAGLMIFSPPDQIANAKNEEMALEKKTKEREKRIRHNKENGQLLVFSTDFENLTPLPPDGDDDTRADRTVVANKTAKVPMKKQRTFKGSNGDVDHSTMKEPTPDAEASFSSVSMEDETQILGAAGAENSIQGSINDKRTEEMLNVIKGLGKDFKKLDRRLSEMHMPMTSATLPPKTSIDNTVNLESKMIQIQTLTDQNTNLEMKNQQLHRELRTVESTFSADRGQFEIEKERLQSELDEATSSKYAVEQTLKEYMDKVDLLENELLPESEEQLRSAVEELNQYKNSVVETGARLQGFEVMIQHLKSDIESLTSEKEVEKERFQILNEESFRAHETMERQSMEKDKIIEEIGQSLKSTKAGLEQERSRASSKEKELKDALMQLKQTSEDRDDIQQKLLVSLDQISKDSEFKNAIISKNMEKSAALQALDEQIHHLKKGLRDMEKEMRAVTKERDEAIFRLGSSDQREEDIFTRLRESVRVRRELHAKVMVLMGSIRVFVRVRPLIANELQASKNDSSDGRNEIFHFTGMGGTQGEKKCMYGSDDPTKNVLEVIEPAKDRGGLSQRRKKWKFGFDQVFDPSHGQEDVWGASEPLVQSAIDGHNVTIFAYGQTGSGKTHTMLGEVGSPDEGLIARSIRKLFEAKEDIETFSRGEKKVNLSLELLEIYNEQVRDLLAEKGGASTSGSNHSLKVVANEAVGSIRQAVANESEVFTILQTAQHRRCVKATSSNATSSRSHLLFTLQFNVYSKDGTIQSGKLNICDLAGSERLGKSGAHIVGGALLEETKHINLSLSTLSNVIEKLQAGEPNVPFRESKLTTMLQNSLGGNSKTLCIVCCNPLQTHFHETLCSLRFAGKISKVDLKAIANFSA